MFGGIGQLASLFKNAGQIKEQAEKLKERLAAARFVGQAGGGQVSATVDGRGELQALKIEPALLESRDVELLEDLIVSAVRSATAQSHEALQKELSGMMGGMNLPGLSDMFK